jgi:transglutaminase-like putative cysteine protease
LFAIRHRVSGQWPVVGRRLAAAFLFLAAFCCGSAQTAWYGLYVQGRLVGYSRFEESTTEGAVTLRGKTLIQGRLLGSDLDMKIDSTTVSKDGRVLTMRVTTESGGRKSEVSVEFRDGEAVAVSRQDGRETSRTVAVPTGAVVVADPLGPGSLEAVGPSGKFYAFDTNVLALIECRIERLGRQTTEVSGRERSLEAVRILDPRANLTVYFSDKGDIVKVSGPMGLELYPEDDSVVSRLGGRPDIAVASRIVPVRPLEGIEGKRSLRYRFTGADLSKAPDDLHQTVKGAGLEWTVEVHPDGYRGVAPAVVEDTDRWLRPDVNVPSDSAEMRSLAIQEAGEGPEGERAERLRLFVHGHVRTDLGIGILRDAREVLASGEGVCRDHAVLLTTLLRAAGIPSRVVAGLVHMDGAFYYHAWCEAFVEGRWVGLDSTRPGPRLTPTHIKLAQGTVADAFTSFLIEGASIEPLDFVPKGDSSTDD